MVLLSLNSFSLINIIHILSHHFIYRPVEAKMPEVEVPEPIEEEVNIADLGARTAEGPAFNEGAEED